MLGPQTPHERCAGRLWSEMASQSVVNRALTESSRDSAAACCLNNVAPPGASLTAREPNRPPRKKVGISTTLA
jgi:hypothetical protein